MHNNPSRTLTHSVAAALVAVFSIVSVAPASAVAKRPSLVVGIMVDGLSMDYIELLRDQFGENGFKRLLSQGLLINDLDYGTALDPAAATAVVFTGAAPQVNGIPAATVYDRDTRRARSVLFDASKIGNFTDETLSPAVNADVAAMAADYIRMLRLGSREATDMLSLGMTVQPYIYGREPDSRLELMDSYLRLDRDLAAIFAAIDREGPGMDRTVVFVAGTPLTRRQRRDDEKWAVPYGEFSSRKAVSLLNMYLMAVHGNGEWVSGYHNGQVYLNHKLIKERGKDLEEMRREAASFLTRMAGVSQAWTVDDVIDRRATDNPDATRRNTAMASAGDIFLAIAPGWQEIDDDSDVEAPQTVVRAGMATAPAFILAPSVAPKEVTAPVDARVLAPTVAGILRIRAPNGASLPRLRP